MSAKTAKSFPGQHEEEEVHLVFNQHPLVMRKQLILGLTAILVGVLPLLAWPLSRLTTKIALFTPLVVLAYWFYAWVGWYYSVYVVTNSRLIEIKQRGFFNRKVTEFGLDKIQNVNYHIGGFQAVLFQYGDITVQSYVGDIVMRMIHRPVQIHEQVLRILKTVEPTTPSTPGRR